MGRYKTRETVSADPYLNLQRAEERQADKDENDGNVHLACSCMMSRQSTCPGHIIN